MNIRKVIHLQKAGYGWNISSGAGKQYALIASKASSIDMYMEYIRRVKI